MSTPNLEHKSSKRPRCAPVTAASHEIQNSKKPKTTLSTAPDSLQVEEAFDTLSATVTSQQTSSHSTPATHHEDPRAQYELHLDALRKQYQSHAVIVLDHLEEKAQATYHEYENLCRIIVPKSVEDTYAQFHRKFLRSIGATEHFMMVWTKHSYIVMDLIRGQLTRFNTLARQFTRSPNTSIQPALGTLFAATKAMVLHSFWYMDNEEPEEADKLVKAVFKTAWNQLLKRSDQELGFADTRTRADLQRWLKRSYKEIHQSLQEDIEEA